MPMTRIIAITAPLFCRSAVIAQPAPANPPAGQPRVISGLPVEGVTVVATKPSEGTIKNFFETRTVRAYWLGRMAQRTLKICPQTLGLGDKYAEFFTQRIRDIATAVGAPVNANPACQPNIEVVFTTTPQDLLDNIHKTDSLCLGFHQTNREGDELAKVSHPIQVWYTSMSQGADERRALGYRGRWLDAGKCPLGGGIAIKILGGRELELPCVHGPISSGSRAKDGLISGFYNVVILAEPAKPFDNEIRSLAKYITLLALSQQVSLDGRQELPSTSNLLAKGCASITSRITDGDFAYLHALYKLPEGYGLNVQHDYIREKC
jgi:hypothetical protein